MLVKLRSTNSVWKLYDTYAVCIKSAEGMTGWRPGDKYTYSDWNKDSFIKAGINISFDTYLNQAEELCK